MCFCRAHYLMLAVVVVLGLASMLHGCGAKGNLYLPSKPAPAQSPAPTESQPQNR